MPKYYNARRRETGQTYAHRCLLLWRKPPPGYPSPRRRRCHLKKERVIRGSHVAYFHAFQHLFTRYGQYNGEGRPLA